MDDALIAWIACKIALFAMIFAATSSAAVWAYHEEPFCGRQLFYLAELGILIPAIFILLCNIFHDCCPCAQPPVQEDQPEGRRGNRRQQSECEPEAVPVPVPIITVTEAEESCTDWENNATGTESVETLLDPPEMYLRTAKSDQDSQPRKKKSHRHRIGNCSSDESVTKRRHKNKPWPCDSVEDTEVLGNVWEQITTSRRLPYNCSSASVTSQESVEKATTTDQISSRPGHLHMNQNQANAKHHQRQQAHCSSAPALAENYASNKAKHRFTFDPAILQNPTNFKPSQAEKVKKGSCGLFSKLVGATAVCLAAHMVYRAVYCESKIDKVVTQAAAEVTECCLRYCEPKINPC